jgi:hypothetical protein
LAGGVLTEVLPLHALINEPIRMATINKGNFLIQPVPSKGGNIIVRAGIIV